MEFLSELWLPIVLSAVFVWVASFIMHMVLPHHKKEWSGLPNEDAVLGALKGIPAGQYMFPWCDMAQMKDPAVQERIKNNPNGTVVVWPGPVNMGKNLGLTLLFYLVVGVFVAYMCYHSRFGIVSYMSAFRIAGTAAFMAYALGWIPGMIWFGGKGFWTYMFDSVVYALVTAGVFGWLWPDMI